MNKTRRFLSNFCFGTLTCLLLIGLASTPTLSHALGNTPMQASSTLGLQPLADTFREIDATAIAQGLPASAMTRYVAVLSKSSVVAASKPSTSAFGAAGAVLVGDRLMIRGNFSNLSSGLRDYATDPLDPPNLNITSGIHLHRGEPTANGPFQYALEVSPDASSLQGGFAGEYTLTSEQLQALSSGNLYVDLHTKQNRAGEMRGTFQPY